VYSRYQAQVSPRTVKILPSLSLGGQRAFFELDEGEGEAQARQQENQGVVLPWRKAMSHVVEIDLLSELPLSKPMGKLGCRETFAW